jgi:hypothetical protein
MPTKSVNTIMVKFLCEVDGDTADEIYTYNQVLDLIEQDNLDMDSDMKQLYRSQSISGHQGPLCRSDDDYKGSTYLGGMGEWGDHLHTS